MLLACLRKLQTPAMQGTNLNVSEVSQALDLLATELHEIRPSSTLEFEVCAGLCEAITISSNGSVPALKAFAGEFEARNRILWVIKDWIQLLPDGISSSVSGAQQGVLTLAGAALEAVASITADLPLIPPNQKMERPELFRTYFALLLQFIDRLTEVMPAMPVQVGFSRNISGTVPGSSISLLRGASRMSLMDSMRTSFDLVTFTDACRKHGENAFGNLLQSNLDVGFEHAFSLAYHDNQKLRCVLLQAIRNILSARIDLRAIADSSFQSRDRYEKLVELVLEPHLYIVDTLCHLVSGDEREELAEIFVHVFEACDALPILFARCLRFEFSGVQHVSQLLRRPTLPNAICDAILRRLATDFFQTLFWPTKAALATSPSTSRKTSGSSSSETTSASSDTPGGSSSSYPSAESDEPTAAIQEFIARLFASADAVPAALRLIFTLAADSLAKARLGFTAPEAISCLLFQRCLTPAIAVPAFRQSAQGVFAVPEHQPVTTLTKVLHAISAHRTIGPTDESALRPFASFIAGQFSVHDVFLGKLLDARRQSVPVSVANAASHFGLVLPQGITIFPSPAPTSAAHQGSVKSKSVSSLSAVAAPAADAGLFLNHERTRDLASRFGPDLHGVLNAQHEHFAHPFSPTQSALSVATEGRASAQRMMRGVLIADETFRLLLQMGAPSALSPTARSRANSADPEDPAVAEAADAASVSPLPFMGQRPPQSVLNDFARRQVCFNAGRNRDGRFVIFHEASKLVSSDFEAYAYFFRAVLSPIFHEKIVLVSNVTRFTAESIPNTLLLKPLAYCISQFVHKPISVFFNPSPQYYAYFSTVAQKNERMFLDMFEKKIIVSTDLNVVKKAIAPLPLPPTFTDLEALNEFPASTVSASWLPDSTFSRLRVGPTALQLVSEEEVLIYQSLSSTNEVVLFSEIASVEKEKGGLRVVQHHSAHLTSKPKVLLIANSTREVETTLCAAFQRFQLQHQSPKAKELLRKAVLSPTTMPGKLLHLAIFNMVVDGNPELRFAGCQLLKAVCDAFDIGAGSASFDLSMLADFTFLLLPNSDAVFISQLSAVLATTEPRFAVEFLDTALSTFLAASEERRMFILQYSAPWVSVLPRLTVFEGEAIEALLDRVIDITCNHPDLFPLFEVFIWANVSHPELVKSVLRLIWRRIVLVNGKIEVESSSFTDICVTLARSSASLVVSELLDHLEKHFQPEPNRDTSSTAVVNLTRSVCWSTVSCVVQLLAAVLFGNFDHFDLEFPRVVASVLLFAFANPGSTLGHALDSLLSNVAHCLACLRAHMSASQGKRLKSKLDDLKDWLARYSFGSESQRKRKPSRAEAGKTLCEAGETRQELEHLASLLMETVNVVSENARYASWKAAFPAAIHQFAFLANSTIRSCAFEVISATSLKMTNELAILYLDSLRDALTMNPCDLEEIQTILLSLVRVLNAQVSSDLILSTFFLMATSLFHLRSRMLIPPLVDLMLRSFVLLEEAGTFKTTSFITFFHNERKRASGPLNQLDSHVCASVDSHCQFFLAGTLCCALTHPSKQTRLQATQLLLALVETERRVSGERWPLSAVPYVVVLLPHSPELRTELNLPSRPQPRASKPTFHGSTASLARLSPTTPADDATPFGLLTTLLEANPLVYKLCLAILISYVRHSSDQDVRLAVLCQLELLSRRSFLMLLPFKEIIAASFTQILSARCSAELLSLVQSTCAAFDRHSLEPAAGDVVEPDSFKSKEFQGMLALFLDSGRGATEISDLDNTYEKRQIIARGLSLLTLQLQVSFSPSRRESGRESGRGSLAPLAEEPIAAALAATFVIETDI
eukprot:m.913781 g.913781  ORF g.913781 m.913781 type:complete len:1817 (+) comp60134_c0_seq2:2-5452(+)